MDSYIQILFDACRNASLTSRRIILTLLAISAFVYIVTFDGQENWTNQNLDRIHCAERLLKYDIGKQDTQVVIIKETCVQNKRTVLRDTTPFADTCTLLIKGISKETATKNKTRYDTLIIPKPQSVEAHILKIRAMGRNTENVDSIANSIEDSALLYAAIFYDKINKDSVVKFDLDQIASALIWLGLNFEKTPSLAKLKEYESKVASAKADLEVNIPLLGIPIHKNDITIYSGLVFTLIFVAMLFFLFREKNTLEDYIEAVKPYEDEKRKQYYKALASHQVLTLPQRLSTVHQNWKTNVFTTTFMLVSKILYTLPPVAQWYSYYSDKETILTGYKVSILHTHSNMNLGLIFSIVVTLLCLVCIWISILIDFDWNRFSQMALTLKTETQNVINPDMPTPDKAEKEVGQNPLQGS